MKPETTVYHSQHRSGSMMIKRDQSLLLASPSRRVVADVAPHLNFGCDGPGARQLAAAILFDYTEDAEVARARFEAFAREVLAVPRLGLHLTGAQISAWLEGRPAPPPVTIPEHEHETPPSPPDPLFDAPAPAHEHEAPEPWWNK